MRELAAYLFLVALLCSSIVTPLAIRLGRRLGILDLPGPRKVHVDPIPLTGGWAIFGTLTAVVWGHLIAAYVIRGSEIDLYLGDRLQYYVEQTPKLMSKVAPVYVGALAMFVVGLVDDVKGMSVKARLVVQVGIASFLAGLGFHPNLGFLSAGVASGVGVLWIVGITNAFNFLDGLDGLSAGVAMVGTMALLSVMGITIQPDVVFFLAALAGTLMGFLRYNYHPARVFLGSSGSLLVGYLMAMGTLQVTYMKGTSDNWLMPLLTPIFVLAIPLYDTTSVVVIRLIQKRSIAIGDQSHFHHRLMRLGFSHRQTVAFMVLLSFSVALSAVRLVQATMFQSLVILVQILSMLSLIILAERVAAKVRGMLLERRKKARPPEPTPSRSTEEPPHRASEEPAPARAPQEQKI
jgi:UDP-GlcNAc:undecaprenyl-phosphate GlcNAc-1-phosphate transferase